MPSFDGSFRDPVLSWSQLRAFDACVRLSSFNAAAAVLGLTPAAVRHQISLLEDRLRATLFLRQGGRLVPTQVGADFSAEIEKPLRALSTACLRAAQGSASSRITLTAPPVFARRFLMGGNFLEWCKRNNVYLDISETKRDLDAIDIAGIRIGAMPHAALEQVRLLDVSLVVAAAPSIAATSRPTDATWWSDQTLLDPEISEGVWPVVWKKLGLASVVPRHRLRFSSYLVALDAARSERGIVLAPSPFVEADLNTQKLMKLTNIRLSAKVGYDFVLRRELAISPRGRALRRRLVAAVKA